MQTKTNNEYWLDNLQMVRMVLENETKAVSNRIAMLKDCLTVCNENKLEQMYDKINEATRLLYEANNMGLREDN